jgi:hypothetical protein
LHFSSQSQCHTEGQTDLHFSSLLHPLPSLLHFSSRLNYHQDSLVLALLISILQPPLTNKSNPPRPRIGPCTSHLDSTTAAIPDQLNQLLADGQLALIISILQPRLTNKTSPPKPRIGPRTSHLDSTTAASFHRT